MAARCRLVARGLRLMARLILSLDGTVLKEFSLDRERTSIGRRPHSDIHIDNLAISGEHALITCSLGDAILQDLDSTNGTFVNGQTIKKHLLVDGDVIGLGKYRLKYFSEATTLTRRADVQDSLRRGIAGKPSAPGAGSGGAIAPQGQDVVTVLAPHLPLAELEILNGGNAGQRLQLTKTRSVIGKPAVQAAAIDRRPGGYVLVHLAGGARPRLNDETVDDPERALADRDVIELAGVRMLFRAKA